MLLDITIRNIKNSIFFLKAKYILKYSIDFVKGLVLLGCILTKFFRKKNYLKVAQIFIEI